MNNELPLKAGPLQDTYADFLTRTLSPEAEALVNDLTAQATAWEVERKLSHSGRATERGPYKRGEKGLASLRDGLARFLGHLLLSKADPERSGKVFRSLKKDTFTGGPVTFPTFEAVWKALEGLELLVRTPGTRRWHPIGFDGPIQLPGTASIFEATPKLLALAQEYGVSLDNIGRHFVPDRGVLELRSYGKWEWSPKSNCHSACNIDPLSRGIGVQN